MFDLSSLLRPDSQKPLKSTRSRRSRHHGRRDHDHRHHETPEHQTQTHHSRRQDRDHRPEYRPERRYPDDNDDYDQQDSQLRHQEDNDRRGYYPRHGKVNDRRDSYRERSEDKDREDVDKGNDDERDGRQSERRGRDGGYRSPSLSRALHRQPGETRQEMQDRVDGQSKRRPKHASEQEPRRSPSHGQDEDSPGRRSMPRRPRFTTTTSYQYPDKTMEDPAPGRLAKSATWAYKDPSQRPKPGGERSHPRHPDNQDPPDHRSHRKRDREPARSPPLAQDDPTITPLHRGYTAFTTSDAYKSGLAGKPWSETERSLFSGSRMDRLPPPGPVRMLRQKDWESKDLDQDLARGIAFEDLGVTVEEENKMPYDQQDELTRCYFPTLGDLDLRLKAPQAQSLSEFADVFVGMKEGYLRVSTHAGQTGMLTNPDSETFQPANRPPYLAFAKGLDDDFEEAERTMMTRSAASVNGGMAGTKELEKSEAWATRGLREQYGWFGSDLAKEPTRKTYRYPDAGS